MKFSPVLVLLIVLKFSAAADLPPSTNHYGAEASQVMGYLQKTFWDSDKGLYTKTAQDRAPDYVWRQAAAFSAVVGAARHEPRKYRPLLAQFFKSLDAYWDPKAAIPGYEPAPTRGNGHDKYYDDNAWLVITFLEAFDLTRDREYLTRARDTARFVLSGWDEKLEGGIWWHQAHKDDSKNTCANGPAAVGFLHLARLGPAGEAGPWLDAARKTVAWTNAKLQASDGLFDDRVIVGTGEIKRGKLTYNSALMLRADLGLYRQTGNSEYLDQAKRIGKAAEWFCDKQNGVYRDPLKWSQFMVEADLELYRATRDQDSLRRARANADAYYAAWKKEPPADMMSNAGIARILWLLADLETTAGRAFWIAAEKPATKGR
jgi:hypothetical protein